MGGARGGAAESAYHERVLPWRAFRGGQLLVVVDALRLAAGSGAAFRLNTLGLGASDATHEALANVDTVSVFLPAADATTYDELLRPRSPGAFDDACAFVRRAAASGATVEVTAVDRPDVAVADVERLARRLGAADFRTRSWLGDS